MLIKIPDPRRTIFQSHILNNIYSAASSSAGKLEHVPPGCTGLDDETLLPVVTVQGVKRSLQAKKILLYCNALEGKLYVSDFIKKKMVIPVKPSKTEEFRELSYP